MTEAATNKHATRSAQTRDRFIHTAQKLYAERSIDSVSLNEITTAAGQKNRNALQYHFGNRDGLIQAIIDSHADAVATLRQAYLVEVARSQLTPAEAAARVLVMPLADYVAANPQGIHYVRILSQLAAINSDIINPTHASRLSFRSDKTLYALLTEALAHLGPPEAQRRLFLVVSITFHGVADVCRAALTGTDESVFHHRPAMFEQVISAIQALISAPPRREKT